MSPTGLSSLYLDLHFDIFSFHFLELFVFVESTFFFRSVVFALLFSSSVYVLVKIRLNSLCTGLSDVVMRWPTVPCLCFRDPTTYRHPNLEGEQVGQQTTALHQSLWRRRWAEGSFVKALQVWCPPGVIFNSQLV